MSQLTALIAVLAVGLLALVLRMASSRSGPPQGESPASASDLPEALDLDDDASDASPDDAVAVTSDGWAFVPAGELVHLVPPGEPDGSGSASSTAAAGAPTNPKTGRPVAAWNPREHLARGDLIGARVKRGAPDHDPWRLEALGRDGEYRAWRFETEEAARLALALLERRVVKPPRGEDGEPAPPGDADFAEAARLEAETEAELATMPEVEADREERPW